MNPPAEDPLLILLRNPVPEEPALSDEVSMVEWLVAHLAHQLAEESDRDAKLRAIARGMRAKATPSQREVIDQAVHHMQYALTRSMAS